uniref:ATP-binding protein n=1 Tax=Prevotella sp. TaxID=59823 RepID=UPI0025FCED1E
MATINNPFVMYGYKGAEYFCDREKETEKMMTSLHNERNITLVAPRRMGKTGLIHHVFQLLEKQYDDVKCFYLDIFATKNLEQMVQLMASKIATFSLDLKPNEGRESLKRIFEYMKQSGKRCYVAIDEFQQIMNYPEDGVEALIRSYIQFLPNVYFVFSGSQQHMMEEMFLSANRPFFQSSLVMSLPCIAESRYLSFANRLLSSQKREVDVDTFTYIYSQADSVTWYVQAILHGIYEHRDEQINKDLVDEVIQELIEEQAMAYQNYCAWLTENQQLLLLAIAKEQIVSSPLSQQFIITHHLPATSSVKTALKALVDKQLISKTPKGFFVSDRFFAKWLAKGE